MKKVRACSRRADTIGESGAKWEAEKKKKERNGNKEIIELSLSPYPPLCIPAPVSLHCRHYLNPGNKVKRHRFLLLIIAELCTDHFL